MAAGKGELTPLLNSGNKLTYRLADNSLTQASAPLHCRLFANSAGNWLPNGVPNEMDVIRIPDDATVTLDSDATILALIGDGSLIMSDNARLSVRAESQIGRLTLGQGRGQDASGTQARVG